jgi:hypothetical protein
VKGWEEREKVKEGVGWVAMGWEKAAWETEGKDSVEAGWAARVVTD